VYFLCRNSRSYGGIGFINSDRPLVVFLFKNDLVAGRLVPMLMNEKIIATEREQINAVYYKSSIVARRILAFIEFIQPRLIL
jgi:hypothetical protein